MDSMIRVKKYMIKYNYKTEIIPILVVILSLVLANYFYVHFPDRVVSHWDINGTPDGFSNRFTGAFAIPGLLVFMYALFFVLPLFDPKKERYESFGHVYRIFRNSILTVLFAIYALSGAYNLGYPINIGAVAPVIIGLLFIILGNYMGKIKPNWFVGIRTPWTLSSENVWNKTHRVGGAAFVLLGILLLLTPLLPAAAKFLVLIVGIVVMVFGTMIYSYLLYKKEQNIKY